MSLDPERSYRIIPKDTLPGPDVVGIGAVPAIFPPLDVPVRIISFDDRWLLLPGETSGTYSVYAQAGSVQPPTINSYRWTIKEENVLFVTGTSDPRPFRFDPAEEGFYVIGIPNEDLLLTANKDLQPQLTLKPADGTDSQRFRVEPF